MHGSFIVVSVLLRACGFTAGRTVTITVALHVPAWHHDLSVSCPDYEKNVEAENGYAVPF